MGLSRASKVSIAYHAIFNYPLSKSSLKRWQAGPRARVNITKVRLPGLAADRRFSEQKLRIAKKAAKVLTKISNIKLVAVTGSLAMMNAREDSDIDLMVVTRAGTLWTTRLTVNLLLAFSGLQLRRAGDKNEKDKLCLNIWLDENDLTWQKKNTFTAHEVCQIVPLINKDKTYERFLWKNKWVLDYWPKAVKIREVSIGAAGQSPLIATLVERLAFWLQYQYMKNKITRETVTKTRALFHPVDWSARLEKRLGRG